MGIRFSPTTRNWVSGSPAISRLVAAVRGSACGHLVTAATGAWGPARTTAVMTTGSRCGWTTIPPAHSMDACTCHGTILPQDSSFTLRIRTMALCGRRRCKSPPSSSATCSSRVEQTGQCSSPPWTRAAGGLATARTLSTGRRTGVSLSARSPWDRPLRLQGIPRVATSQRFPPSGGTWDGGSPELALMASFTIHMPGMEVGQTRVTSSTRVQPIMVLPGRRRSDSTWIAEAMPSGCRRFR